MTVAAFPDAQPSVSTAQRSLFAVQAEAEPDRIVDEWFPVAIAAAVRPDEWHRFDLLGKRCVLACGTDGRVSAFVDTCPHRGARVTLGGFDGERLQCGYHGWQFDLEGRCVYQPAHPGRKPPATSGLKQLSVCRGLGFWWVCFGDRPRSLPIAPAHVAHPERTVWFDPVTVRSSGPRIVENFLDMAHFPFVHAGYLGQVPHTEVARYGVGVIDGELRFTDCVFWQPNPGPAASKGGPVSYEYSVSHPYAALLTKAPAAGGGGFSIILIAAPVHETACVVWRSTVVDHEDNDLEAQRDFDELILAQDIEVLESQRPRRLPVDPRMEIHQPADSGSLAYRKWLRDRGIRYGTTAESRAGQDS